MPGHIPFCLAAAPRRRAQDHVLGDGESLHEPEILVHDPDARLQRGARGSGRKQATPDRDMTGIRAVLTAEDRDQRCLAGSVSAQQGADLAGTDGQVDAIVREPLTERLRDALCLEHRQRRVGGGPPVGFRPR